nr:serine hydrolase domain-containing protein [Ameyamaea chiangmaiensis]
MGLGALAATTACAPRATTPIARFTAVDDTLAGAIAAGRTPGGVVVIGHGGTPVHACALGQQALVPQSEPMRLTTRFDMASLTKPTVTAPCLMQFWERGAFVLDDPVARFLPAFGGQGKAGITIRHVLTHYSGLPPDLPLDTPWSGKPEAVRLAMASPLIASPGARFIYSDINFIVAGLLVEHFSGTTLDAYAGKALFAPLGLRDSLFQPPPALRPEIAPTQFDDHGTLLRGVVHDPTARRMGGVAGHAGLFSDAHDMSVYAQSLLDRRSGRPSAYPLKPQTLVLMTTPQQPAGRGDLRGLGWDIATHYSSPRGDRFGPGSFGHTGFTGTSLWLDPASDSYVLILTNRVHPDGKGNVVALRHDIATRAAIALGL